MTRNTAPIPTLGHRSQKAAIIALYEQRVEPKLIALRTGAPINSVHRALHEYRVKTGRYVAPVRETKREEPSVDVAWDSAYRRRLAAHSRAVAGAREALDRAGL